MLQWKMCVGSVEGETGPVDVGQPFQALGCCAKKLRCRIMQDHRLY